ncbi:MAG: hypothetical protein QXF61_11185 [Nitrososphaeria archaeon]
MSKRCPACGSLNAEEWEKCVICGVLLHNPQREALWWKVVAVHPATGRRLEPRPFSKMEYARIHVERLKALGYEARYFPMPYGRDPQPLVENQTSNLNQVIVRPRARPPEVIPKLNPIEAAQLAQLLMDEGYLRYQRSPTVVHDIYGREYWGYYPRFRVAKTDLEDIEHFAKIWA